MLFNNNKKTTTTTTKKKTLIIRVKGGVAHTVVLITPYRF